MKPAQDLMTLPDIHREATLHDIAIDWVGISHLRLPVQVDTGGADGIQSSVADVNAHVRLTGHQRGIHMSRILQELNVWDATVSGTKLLMLASALAHRLESEQSRIQLEFPYFTKKRAPVSGLVGYMDHEVTLRGTYGLPSDSSWIRVAIPVTTLCPASKAISMYGAHSQRAVVRIKVGFSSGLWIQDIISIAEQSASSQLYSVIKRADEKYVTERAYDNPAFSEDLVREVATQLSERCAGSMYRVEIENLESIHNHSVFAALEHASKSDP